MKKLLLTILLFCPIIVFSQKFIRDKAFSDYKYYDKESKQYLSKKHFIAKYSEGGFDAALIEAVKRGEVSASIASWILGNDKYESLTKQKTDATNLQSGTVKHIDGEIYFFDPQTKEYTALEEYLAKYGKASVDSVWRENPTMIPKVRGAQDMYSSVKMRVVNLTIGSSIVGLSAAGYMIATSAINDKMHKNSKSMTDKKVELDKLSAVSKPDAGKIKVLTDEIRSLSDKTSKLDKSKSTAGYICGATSLIGVVVVLTGLHRDFHGIPVAQNTYINSSDKGLSASIVF